VEFDELPWLSAEVVGVACLNCVCAETDSFKARLEPEVDESDGVFSEFPDDDNDDCDTLPF